MSPELAAIGIVLALAAWGVCYALFNDDDEFDF